MLKYTIKNIKLLLNEKGILWAMIGCVFMSGIMISFSCGIYYNYTTEYLASNSLLTNLVIGFEEDKENNHYVTKEMLDRCLLQFSSDITEKAGCFLVMPMIEDGIHTECRFSIKDGKFASGENTKENFIRANWVDAYFSEEQEREGELVALIYDKTGIQNKTPVTDRLLQKGENGYIRLQGRNYRIIGTQKVVTDSVLVPYASLDKNTVLGQEGLTIMFRTAFTRAQYEEAVNILKKEMGELAIIPQLEKTDNDQIQIAMTMAVIAVLITSVISFNFVILYLYMLDKRKRQMGIFLLCGMSRYRAAGIYIAESILLSVTAFCLGMLAFHILIRPFLYPVYHYLEGFYTGKAYLLIFVVYCVASSFMLGTAVAVHVLKKPIRYYL